MIRSLTLLIAILATAGYHVQGQNASFSHPISASEATGNIRGRANLPDTVHVLALMVDFQPDTDNRTTGTGKFGSVYPQDFGKSILDPLPHDRNHFRNHLTFLQNYMYKVSGGRTSVAYDVLDGIVTVPKEMSAYSPRRDESNKRVADLVVDAWSLADSRFPNVDWSQYHFFIIFHAGIGRDINLASIQGYTPNPYDIPSLYIGLSAMKEYYGASYEGIPMRGGTDHIPNTAVIPSTETRIVPSFLGGEILLNITINGLIAASFGSWAGLPDLFDTKTGNTGIGRFGLMDGQSIFSWGGISPPEPSAWEKDFLGWATPRVATPGRREYLLTAHRTDQITTSDVLRVPVTADEYWLLENRRRDPAGNGQEVTIVSEGQTVKMRFAKDQTGFSPSDLTALRGVVVDLEDVDWMLPGGTVIGDTDSVFVAGGILIWHIDENIIRTNLASNTVNADRRHRGIDLEQAAGPQDIGEELESPFGTTIGEGTPLDYWFEGNISPLYKNSFGKTSYPASRTNEEYDSHVTVDRFSRQGSVMSCEISLGDDIIRPLAGFPVKLFESRLEEPTALSRPILQTADLDGDGLHELMVSNGYFPPEDPTGMQMAGDPTEPRFFIVRQDATGFLSSDPAAPAGEIYSSSLVLADTDGDGRKEIIAGDAQRTSLFASVDGDGDGKADSLRSWGAAHGNLIGFSDGFAFLTAPDTLVSYRTGVSKALPLPAGERSTLSLFGIDTRLITVDSRTSSAEVIDLETESVDRFTTVRNTSRPLATGRILPGMEYQCVLTDGTSVAAYSREGLLTGFPPATGTETPGHIAIADVDGDGRNDIIATYPSEVRIISFAGAVIDHFPVPSVSSSRGTPPWLPFTLAARPANGGGALLFHAGASSITLRNDRGLSLEGFPILTAPNPECVLFPLGKENRTLGLAVAGTDGYLYVYDLGLPVNGQTFLWRSRFRDERNTNCLTAESSSNLPWSEFFPEKRCYNWPNPVYGSTTKIRYYVSKDANVSVTIYDFSGTKVGTLSARAVGGIDNEIDWDISGIESGIYLARVEAEAGGDKGTKIIKIAVVK